MATSKTTKAPAPTISERMSYGNGLEAFTTSEEPTWTASHHKRTFWLSDELWNALGDAVDSAAKQTKSNLAEELLRAALNMEPHA
jgi:hypothetical protein